MIHYFAKDGNYGIAENFRVFETSDWTKQDWQKIENCSDGERLEIAINIAEDKAIKDHPVREIA
jgi:hypothetical protein